MKLRQHDSVRIEIRYRASARRPYEATLRGDSGAYVSPVMRRFTIDALVRDAVLVASDHSKSVEVVDRTGEASPRIHPHHQHGG